MPNCQNIAICNVVSFQLPPSSGEKQSGDVEVFSWYCTPSCDLINTSLRNYSGDHMCSNIHVNLQNIIMSWKNQELALVSPDTFSYLAGAGNNGLPQSYSGKLWRRFQFGDLANLVKITRLKLAHLD